MEAFFDEDSPYFALRDDPVFKVILEKCVLADYDAFEPVRNMLNAILDLAHLAGLDSVQLPGSWNQAGTELLRLATNDFDHFLFCASGMLNMMQSERSVGQRMDPLDLEESYSNLFLYIEAAVETYWTDPNYPASRTNRDRLKDELAQLLLHFLKNQLAYDSLAFGDFENLLVKIYQSEWMMGNHWDGLVVVVEEILKRSIFDGVEHLPIKMSGKDDYTEFFTLMWGEDENIEKVQEEMKQFSTIPDNEKTCKSLLAIFSLLSSIQVSHDIFHYDISGIQKLMPRVLQLMGYLSCCLVFLEDSASNFHEFLEAILDDILDYFFVCRKSYHQKRIDPRYVIDEECQNLIDSLYTLLLLLVEIDRSLYYFVIPTLSNHFQLCQHPTWLNQFNYMIGKLPDDFPFYDRDEEEVEDEEDDAKDDYLKEMLYSYTEIKIYPPADKVVGPEFFVKVFKLIFEHEAMYKEDIETILLKTVQLFIRFEGEDFFKELFSDLLFWRQSSHVLFYFGTLILALQRGALDFNYNTTTSLLKTMEFNFFEFDNVVNLSTESDERIHLMCYMLPFKCLMLRHYSGAVNQTHFASILKDVKKLMNYGEAADEEMKKTCKFYSYLGKIIELFYPNFATDTECEYLNYTSISLSLDQLLDYFLDTVPFPDPDYSCVVYPAIADYLSYYNFIVSNQQQEQPILFQDLTLLFYVILSYPSFGESYHLVDKFKSRNGPQKVPFYVTADQMKKLQHLNLKVTSQILMTYWFPQSNFQSPRFQMEIQRDLKILWDLRTTAQYGWTEKNHQFYAPETRDQIRTLLAIWSTGGEEFLFSSIPRDVLYHIFTFVAGRVDVQELLRSNYPFAKFGNRLIFLLRLCSVAQDTAAIFSGYLFDPSMMLSVHPEEV